MSQFIYTQSISPIYNLNIFPLKQFGRLNLCDAQRCNFGMEQCRVNEARGVGVGVAEGIRGSSLMPNPSYVTQC